MEQCCGTTCNKAVLEKELKVEGAVEFVAYLECNIAEGCSTAAIQELLSCYIEGL